jgi:hypothetical protein
MNEIPTAQMLTKDTRSALLLTVIVALLGVMLIGYIWGMVTLLSYQQQIVNSIKPSTVIYDMPQPTPMPL